MTSFDETVRANHALLVKELGPFECRAGDHGADERLIDLTVEKLAELLELAVRDVARHAFNRALEAAAEKITADMWGRAGNLSEFRASILALRVR